MIIDLPRFIGSRREAWQELEKFLDLLQNDQDRSVSYEQAKRFHLLFQNASADLARLSGFAAESELRQHLESLVARAYGEIHGSRRRKKLRQPFRWFTHDFPTVFRRRQQSFLIAVLLTMAGVAFGSFAMLVDPDAKSILLPSQFSPLNGTPTERVKKEESAKLEKEQAGHSTFAGFLIQNNIKVSILTLATGMLWGLGPAILLFQNGVTLGLIAFDYIMDGQTVFLLGWLMPHGVIEIPSLLFAGQAGLILGNAVIGAGSRLPLADRLRAVSKDVITLIQGIALFLVWAGIIESFLSQYHQPVIPYWAKIGFGSVELAALIWFLYFKELGSETVVNAKSSA